MRLLTIEDKVNCIEESYAYIFIFYKKEKLNSLYNCTYCIELKEELKKLYQII